MGFSAIEIVEASALIRFLDFGSDGQYVREKMLGIPAERLSPHLLEVICKESLAHHASYFPATHAGNWQIRRNLVGTVSNVLTQQREKLVVLQGPSGFGKSTGMRQIGEYQIERGGLALWIPETALVTGATPESVVLGVLRHFRSGLGDSAGREAFEIAEMRQGGIAFLVDDVNRLPNPDQGLQTCFALATPRLNCCWLIPIWPGQLPDKSPEDPFQKRNSRAFVVDVSRYSPSELTQLKHHLPTALCEALDGDPFLCALAPADTGFGCGPKRSDIVSHIVEAFLARACQDAANSNPALGVAGDFAAALDELVLLTLKTDDPTPAWMSIRSQLAEPVTNRLMALLGRRRIAWLDSEKWRWAHDRLRDLIVGRWLGRQSESDRANALNNSWIRHPGLAEAWAAALAFMPAGVERVKLLERFCVEQPLVLAITLRLRFFPNDVDEREIIRRGLSNAISARTGPSEVDLAFWTCMRVLEETDDRLVLDTVPESTRSPSALMARFRNGDINAGLQLIQHFLPREFLPFVNFRDIEATIAAFSLLLDSQRNALVAAATRDSEDDASTVECLLIAAGYTGWPEWLPFVRRQWQRATMALRDELWPAVTWALARCCDGERPTELREAVLHACELMEAESQANPSEKITATKHAWFHFSHVWVRWEIGDGAAKLFAHVCAEHSNHQYYLCHFLKGIDLPDVVRQTVRAQTRHLMGEPVDPLSEYPSSDWYPVATATRAMLWHAFHNESDESIRKRVLSLWKRGATVRDLHELRQVCSSDSLFDQVLAIRLRLGDRQAAPLLIERMKVEPAEWCGYAPAVFDETGVASTFDECFERAFEGWSGIEYCIQHFSHDQLRALLQRKQHVFLKESNAWPALLRSDLPEALDFVAKAIAESGSSETVRHFFMVGGFPFPVSLRMLNSLTPILHMFSTGDLEFYLARLAIESGHVAWVREYIVPLLPSDDSLRLISVAAAKDRLTRAAAQMQQGERSIWRTDARDLTSNHGEWLFERVPDVLREWLGSSPSLHQIQVAGAILERLGTGDDLDWWNRLAVSEDGLEAHRHTRWLLQRRRWQPAGHSDG